MTEPTTGTQVIATPHPKPPIAAGAGVMAIVPRDLDEAWRYSVAVVKAGMVPKSYEGRSNEETVSKIMLGINKGLEVGMAPQAALASIMIVNNRPSLWGDGALGLVHNSGKLENFKEWIEGTPGQDGWTAHCLMKRSGIEEPVVRSFSYGEAKAAQLTGKPGPWKAYPRRMLQMRARAFAIRDGFADVLCGLGIVEEQSDIPSAHKQAPDVGFLDDDTPALSAPVAAEILELEEENTPSDHVEKQEPESTIPEDVFPGDIPAGMSAEDYYSQQAGRS